VCLDVIKAPILTPRPFSTSGSNVPRSVLFCSFFIRNKQTANNDSFHNRNEPVNEPVNFTPTGAQMMCNASAHCAI